MAIIHNIENLQHRNIIDICVRENKIINNSNSFTVKDFDTLLFLINLYYPDFSFMDFHNENVNNMINELFRLIFLKQYELAYKLANRIDEIVDIEEIKLIIKNIDRSKSNIIFMMEPNSMEDGFIKDDLLNIEKEALVDFLAGDIKSGCDKMTILSMRYIHQTPIYFSTYAAYIYNIALLKKNPKRINNRVDVLLSDNPAAVLNILLRHGDILAAHNLLNRVYINQAHEEFYLAFEIYRVLDKILMETLNKNMKNVKKEIAYNSNGINDINEITKDYELTNITAFEIDKMDKIDNSAIDPNIDYLEEYQTYKNNKEYEKAKIALYKHQKLTKDNCYYLIVELDILMQNQNDMSEYDEVEHDSLLEEADKLISNRQYELAMCRLFESFNYETVNNPTTYAKIAECYKALEEYQNAALVYEREASICMQPMDYIHYIECLYKIGHYSELFDVADEFEYYYPCSSAYIHYILSIVYLKRNKYKHALDEIDTCEIICMQTFDMPLNFNYERKVIEELEKGIKREPYKLNDYYNHCFTENTLNRIKKLDIDSHLEDGSLLIDIMRDNTDERLEDKINYLLRLGKVLVELDRRNDASDLFKYLDELIKCSELSLADSQKFTYTLKNYRNL